MKNSILTLFIFFTFYSNSIYPINPIGLEKQISNLNDQHKHQEAILLLEEIITAKGSTNFDIYNAYLQKAYTYKRLYNYAETNNNLNIALKFGLKSDQKELVKIQILLEKKFIEFDLKNFDNVNKLLAEVNPKQLKLISGETKAFYLSILSNLAMRDEKYDIAEQHLDEAISIVAKQNPKHLPNIYRVKVALYGYTKEADKVLDAYEKGLFYANKYDLDIYKIIMHDAIIRYYTQIDDYRNAFLIQKILNEANTKYDSRNKSGQLALLEKELLEEKKKNELETEKKYNFFLISLISISIILLIVLFLLYRVNKQKKVLAQKENKRIRKELDFVSKKLIEKEDHKEEFNLSDLTERQKQIVNLVKLGKTNKEIGADLFISENTVKYHLKIIYDILKIENRLELK